jgi:membrane-bound inhibitor of C-type lysozyme
MKKNFSLGLFFAVLFVVFTLGAAFAQYDEIFIINGEDTYVMVRVESASGEKYVALGGLDDAPLEFMSKGDEAMLTFNEKVCDKYVLLRGSANKDELFLTVDGKNYRMKQAISASGVQYRADGDSRTELLGKGKDVTLLVEGVEYPGYDAWQPLGRIWLPNSVFHLK